MPRIIQLLKCRIIDPLIVEPLRAQLTIYISTLTDFLNDINDSLDMIKDALHVDKSTKRIPLVFAQDLETGFYVRGDITNMQIRDDQKFRIEFGKPLDKKGNAASVQEGSVSISVTDGSATVEPDPTNPFAATIIGVSPTADITKPGAVIITADADLGEGVRNITGSEPLIVTGGQAVGFGPASVGTAEDQ